MSTEAAFEIKDHCIYVTTGTEEPSEEEYKQYLDKLTKTIEENGPTAIVFDLRHSKNLSAKNRMQQSRWNKEKKGLLKAKVNMIIFVNNSMFLRTIINTINTFTPSPVPQKVVGTPEEAEALAEKSFNKSA